MPLFNGSESAMAIAFDSRSVQAFIWLTAVLLC
jgi:hypothetical protein